MNPFPIDRPSRTTAFSLFTPKAMVAVFCLVVAARSADSSKLVGATYAMDDMSLSTPPSLPSKMGVYFWIPKDEWYFKSTMSRVADAASTNGNGYVSFISTHNEKCYHPVGVSFGSDASNKPFFIDMSGEKGDSVTIEAENLASVSLRVRITIKDDAENMIDTKPETPIDQPWAGAFEFDVKPKATVTKTFAYTGGYYAEWKSLDKCNLFADPTNKALPCGVQKADMTRIAGANITINSTTPDATGITNAELRIHKMSFGAVPTTGVRRGARQIPTGYPSNLNAIRMGLVGYPVADGRTFDIHGRQTKVTSAP